MPRRPLYSRLKTAAARFGERGECAAARLLESLGMMVICRNYEAPGGEEIDLVALDGEVLCFVEVKARRPRTRHRPADAVTVSKRYRLVRAARHYLRQLQNPPIAYRFDLVEVVQTRWRVVELRHWPEEFTSDEVARQVRGRDANRVWSGEPEKADDDWLD